MADTQAMLWGLPSEYDLEVKYQVDNYEKANNIFVEAHLKAHHHDLSECEDEEGLVYKIEKYCYSTPSNLIIGRVDEGLEWVFVDVMDRIICWNWKSSVLSIPNSICNLNHWCNHKTLSNALIQLTLDFDPSTPISSVVSAVKEKLEKDHQITSIQSIKMIYRGFILEEQETLFSVLSLTLFH